MEPVTYDRFGMCKEMYGKVIRIRKKQNFMLHSDLFIYFDSFYLDMVHTSYFT